MIAPAAALARPVWRGWRLAQNEKTGDAAAREQRLAAALRQNLRKRKLQQAGRQQPEGEETPGLADDDGAAGRARDR